MSGKFGVELATMQTPARHVDEVNAQIQSQLDNLPPSGLERLETEYLIERGASR